MKKPIGNRCENFFREFSEILKLEPSVQPTKLQRLTKRALRAGCEGSALNAQLHMLLQYQISGDQRGYRAALAHVSKLEPRVLPANWARRELEHAFGVASSAPEPSEGKGNALAVSIFQASKARLARTRRRDLESLREQALGTGKKTEALIADLFLLAEYAKAGNWRRVRERRNEIAELEQDAAVRVRLDIKVTERLDSVYNRPKPMR